MASGAWCGAEPAFIVSSLVNLIYHLLYTTLNSVNLASELYAFYISHQSINLYWLCCCPSLYIACFFIFPSSSCIILFCFMYILICCFLSLLNYNYINLELLYMYRYVLCVRLNITCTLKKICISCIITATGIHDFLFISRYFINFCIY